MRTPLSLATLAAWILLLVLPSCQPSADKSSFSFIDTTQFNTAIKPGDDFFSYVNGKWYDTVKIISTESGVGSFYDLVRTTRDRLMTTLDSLSRSRNSPGSIEKKVGDMYASGMDSIAIEKRGAEPVKPYLRQIDSIRDVRGIMQYASSQQRQNNDILFDAGVNPDDRNSAMNIAVFSQGGLGLPDREYYFKTDSATLKVVKAYQTYIRELFILTGDDSVSAGKKTLRVYDLEKELAASHKTNVELLDPVANYHKMQLAGLDRSMPVFGWKKTLDAMGWQVDSVNIQQPAYYAKLDQLLKTAPLDTWKDYLRAHTLFQYANRLSDAFVDASFQYIKTVSGQEKLKPRAERMVEMVDATLGEALGQLYVKKYFTTDARQRMLDLVNNLQKAFSARIDKLDWMTDSTRTTAKEKLFAFIKKIGYPDKWRDYTNVRVDRNSYFENRISAAINEYEYHRGKLGKPVDKTDWGMTPPTINAYYNPLFNEIVFPAGILQPPFFDPAADDAANYGGIGMFIGHEMTHGFDNQGSQYDKNGNLRNWWTKADSSKFSAKTGSVVTLYNGFVVLDTLHVNGALTIGENIADIGGVAVAYDAFKLTKEGHDSAAIDGFTPDQRFFLSYGRAWRIRVKDELLRTAVNTDPHSPEKWRVNGPLMNFSPFYRAFNVQPGQKMYRPEDQRIWIW